MAWRRRLHSFALVCLGSSFVLVGCAKDLGDEIGAGTETSNATETGTATETGDGDGGDSPLDATGIYLLAIETSLGPDLPLQFVLEIDNVIITDDGATADFVFHTLSLEQGGTVPGECLDGPLSYEGVAFDMDGNFVLDMGLVPFFNNPDRNDAPPPAEITLHGHLVDPDAMCGEVEGMLMSPLEFDLAGSTFAAIPLADGCDAEPFPGPIYKCSML